MLYTGKGDGGTTKFFDTKSGERVSKSSGMAHALGLLDELNSFVGLCKVKSEGADCVGIVSISDILEDVQQNLFIVQAEVAGHPEKKISVGKIKAVEGVIAAIEKEIPPVISFTVVGGSELSAFLDVARTIARKAERAIIGICDAGERQGCEDTRAYLNRLSSLLFALARFVNFKRGIKEKNPHYE